jgi:hypothetical protein
MSRKKDTSTGGCHKNRNRAWVNLILVLAAQKSLVLSPVSYRMADGLLYLEQDLRISVLDNSRNAFHGRDFYPMPS